MPKNYLILLLVSASLLVLFLTLRWSGSESEAAGKPAAAQANSTPPSPSAPFDASAFTPGEKVSAASIARLETRANELRETRAQLSVKMESIDKRLTDAAEAPNTPALREAKQALETSMEKMEAEERALAEFLLNEQEGQESSP